MNLEIRVQKVLSPSQKSAISRAILLGKKLQKDCPEIAERYRGGTTLPGIAREFDITHAYKVTQSIAEKAVQFAIKGYKGGFFDAYNGLIHDSLELEALRQDHRVNNGQRYFREGIGIHTQSAEEKRGCGRRGYKKGLNTRSPEQISRDSRKGALIMGCTSYQQGLGIHGRTPEERKQDTIKAIAARGLTPWISGILTDAYGYVSEIEFAFNLSSLPQYQNSRGTNNRLIAEHLNAAFHGGKPVRYAGSVKRSLYKFRKATTNQ
jgi:hypothetical protein